MGDSAIVLINSMVKRFPIGGSEFTALDNINLTFNKGEFSGVVGPSGSGKTTLLNIVGSLDKPSEGTVTVLGKSIENLSHKQAAELRSRHFGFIFQTYNLLPYYSVYENVEFPLLLLEYSPKERKEAVLEAIETVGLSGKIKSLPSQLSGGEGQRVAIARAMVKKPVLVLADEPTANLDAKNAHNILQTMEELNSRLGTTFIFSSHDEKVIQYLHRKITLEDGHVSADERWD